MDSIHQPKDLAQLNGCFKNPQSYHMLPTRNSFHKDTQSESEGLDKDTPGKWKSKVIKIKQTLNEKL